MTSHRLGLGFFKFLPAARLFLKISACGALFRKLEFELPRKNHLEFNAKFTWKTWKSPGIPLLQSPNNPVI